jgi:hypothetical protein
MSLACSCGYSDTGPRSYPPFLDSGDFKVVPASLQEISGCDRLLAALKQSAIEEMRLRVLKELEWALEYDCYGDCDWGNYCASDGGISDGGSSAPPPEEGADEYSTTNIQEPGVDEADFLKNDGKYIYILAGAGLAIIEAWPAPDTRILSSFPIEGTPRLLFVYGDRAVVYSDVPGGLKITVLNITDRHNPILERETHFSGLYASSRRIGTAVYTVVEHPEARFPRLNSRPDELEGCGNHSELEIRWAFYRLMRENERSINQANLGNWLPSARDTKYFPDGRVVEEDGLFAECRNFYVPPLFNGHGFLTIASLDILDLDASIHQNSIVGQPGVVYASRESLYIASPYLYDNQNAWYFPDSDEIREAITIHRFSLCHSPAESYYEASGVVDGLPLNQFSMSEHRGHLRIATTSFRQGIHNSVFVLEQQGPLIQTIGKTTGIAPGENIYAVRFAGDRGFVVTFQVIDPLFTLDLSDPKNPVVAGELEVPGYSTYIHMLDKDHLLTIGIDGQGTRFDGVQLQIFDISDMNNPTRMHKEAIGTRGNTSEATSNHLAFNYFPPKEVLALPMAICEGDYNENRMTFNGLLVYDVTLDRGFSERGRVPHPNSTGHCDWWTNPDSRVRRSIIMDDYVYSVSKTQLKVNHLNDLGNDVAVLDLPPIP